MSRQTHNNQPRRLAETGNDSSDENGFDNDSALLADEATRREPAGRNGVSVRNERATVEEIAAVLMQVADKKERCWDFDLQYWLSKYQTIRAEVNFPVVSMVVNCSAHIYGRKVDFLSDMVMNMNADQKSREKEQSSEESTENPEEAAGNAIATRKRPGRNNPQSGSGNCFSDLEFTPCDTKLLKLEALIKPPTVVEVDRRTKFQQMQELCNELRANPARQRRQEILNRLRDEACIAPMLSSHGVARKNQILDLESGETIGTRYDYQIHQNYIDGRTGSLIAEHDLKRFFQRCDVMDFMYEQLESERKRCTRLGMPTPTDLFPVKAREVKIFLPPEYLKDRYRISVNDTSDFENALVQARITNYSSDPILSLMDAEERERRCKLIDEEELAHSSAQFSAVNDSGFDDGTAETEEPSFSDVLCSSQLNGSACEDTGELQCSTKDSTQATVETSEENPLETELMTLESDSSMSVDEGIGVDCESPPRSTSTTKELSSNVMFSSGTVITRHRVQLPVERLLINLFGLPERLMRKNCSFALPTEYRKMKMNLVQFGADRTANTSKVNLYSLHPSATRNPLWDERPTTPDLEDFLGFTEEEAPVVCQAATKLSSKSPSPSENPSADRPSIPESDFEGFTEEEVAIGRRSVPQLLPKNVANLSNPTRSPKQQKPADGTSSQPLTPSRTLSCDSGISDSAERGKESGLHSDSEPLMSEQDEGFDSELPESATDALEEHTRASNARIQERTDEIQQRIQKVNDWHKKLRPILIESEKRNHFDIHEHGTEIIDTFDRAPAAGDACCKNAFDDLQRPSITFASVLQNKPAHSTARYFLSMLMLANTNNVEIVNKNRDPLRLSTTAEIELRLISRKRHHQEMEALGELLPSESDPDRGLRKRQNRKRKMLHAHNQGTFQVADLLGETAGVCVRPDPAERLSSRVDEPNFLDNVQQMYPDLNSDDSKRMRMAFRRGMRSCVYGLGVDNEETSTTADSRTSEPPPKTPPPDPPCSRQRFASLQEDDILQVDLLTNCATLVAARDEDKMCTKSVFSLAESGYESMNGEGNSSR